MIIGGMTHITQTRRGYQGNHRETEMAVKDKQAKAEVPWQLSLYLLVRMHNRRIKPERVRDYDGHLTKMAMTILLEYRETLGVEKVIPY